MNLAKYQREFRAVETFAHPIPITCKQTPLLLCGNQPIDLLEASEISSDEDEEGDTTPTCARSSAASVSSHSLPFYQDPAIITPRAL